ncbi:PREDICTED: C-C motif chemokine 19, partial [Merops nubicus]|uniref:C-C motif chemokine 19 n=1 Tax=Merops nubicus TaxID=57421 RepID=UPI0004F04B88
MTDPPPGHGANNVLDCCLRTKETPIPRRIVQYYRLQLVQDGHGANNVLDCCLRTKETPIPRRIVQYYRLQLVQDGCDIPAAVFITTKGKRLCAPLQAPWVVRLQEKLDASSARR